MVLDSDSLIQDMNSMPTRTNTVISASVSNLEISSNTRICHLCLEEYGTLKDLKSHILTHNLNHPSTYYSSNSTLVYINMDTTQENNSLAESLMTINSEDLILECNRSGQGFTLLFYQIEP